MPRFPAKHAFLVVTCVVIATATALAGCGGDDENPPPASPTATQSAPSTTAAPTETEPAPTTTTPAGAGTVQVFFADADGAKLVQETRPVNGAPDLRAALVALADGPTGTNAIAALPSGTQVVGTLVRDGEALVNLSQAFVDGYPSGGAAAEFAVIAPLVYTATAVEGIDRIRITVDGKPAAPAGSQYDWTKAFTRDDVSAEVVAP